MWMAKAKQATTIATQTALAVLDLAVEMCTRPWIVELSKNSLTFDKAMSFAFWIIWSVAQVNMVAAAEGELNCCGRFPSILYRGTRLKDTDKDMDDDKTKICLIQRLLKVFQQLNKQRTMHH